ncbi:PorP/SprF family type IX secretion system membrane protein [Pseudoflavitalea sp. G-6-1-2]|uniref:PorP/SprF family type IX secretion system membrane protein n=1 Tax=Pseudoflavitalea sp. G-6-1-2 TaxID=2728841 RepID=UPI00146DF9E1|nr:PorP/SprF family type IX secretion system membrane protein [Pseudoflavitalea sp. G-6-1-2]NML20731.1 PorP/SprF family type IX secretion system membrane protein [Pseudoflavitalea sp. G-6-1-2]
MNTNHQKSVAKCSRTMRSGRRSKLSLLLTLSGLLLMGNLSAQDMHFSQWFNSPLSTNPANTGFIPDADYRIGANYRNQWSSIMTMPYKTYSVWGDAQVFRDKIASGWLGIGGLILRDQAGSGSLTSTKIYGSVAYHQMVGVAHLISAGFNLGWANKRVNSADLKFPDQFDGEFFDSKLPTNAILDNNSVSYLDVQMGFNYAFFPNDKVYLNAGVSAWHINRPRESFFSTDPLSTESRIPIRYTAFANASVKVNDDVIVNPMVYYSRQANASEVVGGAYAQYNLADEGEMQVLGGLYYRPNDAIIPMIGFEWKSIRLTFTYDVTTSTLKQYNNRRGALEFALMKRGFYDDYNGDRRQSLCPTFKY